MTPIEAVEVIAIVVPDQARDDLDGTVETVIVKVIDAAGLSGFGDADAPAGVVKSFLTMPTAHNWSRNIGEILIGQDPVEITALWQKMYDGTFWPGRRGLGCGWQAGRRIAETRRGLRLVNRPEAAPGQLRATCPGIR